MLLYIIGLATIPKELLEAATIDEAGPWRKLISIKIPLLTPIILFNLIVGVINNFQYFDQVFVLTQGGPNKATLFSVFNIYRTAFEYFELGYASALAVNSNQQITAHWLYLLSLLVIVHFLLE